MSEKKKDIKALVVSDSCPHCHTMQEYLSRKGLMSKVKVINFGTEEGRKFCVDHNISAVPECVVIEQDGKEVRVCSPKEFEALLQDGC
jgi:predicted thioredoxin/glutaredoxin